MAIENIHLYDHIRFDSRALRPVIKNFFSVTKRTTNSDNKKIQLKLARKRCRSLKAILCLSKFVPLSLNNSANATIWHTGASILRIGKKVDQKKRKSAKSINNFCFFSKTIIFKIMKTISYKLEYLNMLFYSINGSA